MAIETYPVRGIPSSFVFSNMKLLTDKGAGEAKLFVGPKSKETDIDEFFEFGNGYVYTFDKKNVLEYMLQVKMEYVFQTINKYKVASLDKWNEMYSTLSELDDLLYAVHLEKFTDASRYYVRADQDIFKNCGS